jgi:hypothetical protein
MLTHKQIAYQYIQACQVQSCYENQMNTALQQINPDNQVFGLADPLHKGYRELVEHILGQSAFEWVEWWQYECDYGMDARDFALNNVEYSTDDMTTLSFLELVIQE